MKWVMKSVQAYGSLLSSRYIRKTGVHELKVFIINELNKRTITDLALFEIIRPISQTLEWLLWLNIEWLKLIFMKILMKFKAVLL